LFTAYKTTIILLDGKRVKLQLWDASGQGRLCTIIRSYSRGAQGVLLVYDITNKWSFDGLDRWLKEVEEVYINSYIFEYKFIFNILYFKTELMHNYKK
jgi:GTPase SAR1 family protein